MISEKIADGRLLRLIEMYLRQEIVESNEKWIPEEGMPQGAVLSPLLSNIYLDRLDKRISLASYKIVRYADDFVVLCKERGRGRESNE